MMKRLKFLWPWLVSPLFWVILLCLLCCSCRSVKYIPVESVRHDSIYITAHQRDSIYTRDSIYVLDKGDTTYIYKDKFIYVYNNKTDTIFRNTTDTITQVVEVERELTRWQKFRMDAGGWAMGVLLIVIIFGVGRIIYNFRH